MKPTKLRKVLYKRAENPFIYYEVEWENGETTHHATLEDLPFEVWCILKERYIRKLEKALARDIEEEL